MLHSSEQIANSHRLLIGPPLLIITVFCFSFLTLQAHGQLAVPPINASQLDSKQSTTQPDLSHAFSSVTAPLTIQPDATAQSAAQPLATVSAKTIATTVTAPPVSATTISPQLSNNLLTGPLQAASPTVQTIVPAQLNGEQLYIK